MLGYSWGPASLSLQWQHLPATEDANEALFLNGLAEEGTDNSGLPAYNLFNLNGSYELNENVRLRFGIDNLFNKRPPITGIDVDTDPTVGELPGGGFSFFHDVQGRRFSARREPALLTRTATAGTFGPLPSREGLSLASNPPMLMQKVSGGSMAKVVRIHALAVQKCCRSRIATSAIPGPARSASGSRRSGSTGPRRCIVRGAIRCSRSCPSLIGYEGVGIVEALGDKVEGFATGDRVCVLPMIQQGQYGIWAEQAIVPTRILLPAPPDLTPAEAASIWMQYMTAFALIEVAEIGIGDGVIVRAASSSVGIAAIQLANWAGSVSIACTRTSDKADALREQGAAHVVATEEEDSWHG